MATHESSPQTNRPRGGAEHRVHHVALQHATTNPLSRSWRRAGDDRNRVRRMTIGQIDTSLGESDFDFIRQLVRDRSAIVLEDDKMYLVESRLTPVARAEGIGSLGELVHELRSRPFGALHHLVIEAMTTNETSFFRDRRPFEMLKDELIPELYHRRASERRLRIWCAACSSGQEPYTIAMVIEEHFPTLATSWTVDILGTDLSTHMIRRSKEGIYSQLEVMRGLPAYQLVKNFDKVGAEWQVKEELRKKITFREMNLAGDWPLSERWDIIFLRNVLIYFDLDTKRSILAKVRHQLRPDGYLLLGGAETTINIDEEFERIPAASAGCYRLRAQPAGVYAIR